MQESRAATKTDELSGVLTEELGLKPLELGDLPPGNKIKRIPDKITVKLQGFHPADTR